MLLRPNGEAGGIATLDYHDDWVIVLVTGPQVGFLHLLIQDCAKKLEDLVSWIIK
jgi:hypothetical protein